MKEGMSDAYFGIQNDEFKNAMAVLAKLLRINFDILVNAGFQPMEALYLTHKLQIALMAGELKTGGK